MLAKKYGYKPKVKSIIQQYAFEKRGMKSPIKFKHINLGHLSIEHYTTFHRYPHKESCEV
jgi:hypothetical protein